MSDYYRAGDAAASGCGKAMLIVFAALVVGFLTLGVLR